MKYAYILQRQKCPVHELDESGRTYCQAENSSNRLSLTDQFPPNRRECWACKGIKREREYRRTHGVLDAEFRSVVG